MQIRTCWHLPLTLLAMRLRLRVRAPGTWARLALTCALMLLPSSVVAVLERKARRCFLAARLQGNPDAAAALGRLQTCGCEGACASPMCKCRKHMRLLKQTAL